MCKVLQLQQCCKALVNRKTSLTFSIAFMLNLIFQRKTRKKLILDSLLCFMLFIGWDKIFFVSCVCLHNKNQKVFIFKSMKTKQKRFFGIACVTNSNTKNCTRQTSPRRFVFCLFAFQANPDGRNFSEFARSEETTKEHKECLSSPLANSFWKLLVFCVLENCFVSWSESELGLEALKTK